LLPKGVEVHYERQTDLNNNAAKDQVRRKQRRAAVRTANKAARAAAFKAA
jgi:hypothetical protein